jgi:DNA-binding IclR family transcriptional regulator
MLETLREIETLGGTLAGVWLDASGVGKQSFYRAAKRLVDAGYVKNPKHGRYELTPAGAAESLKVSLTPRKVA